MLQYIKKPWIAAIVLLAILCALYILDMPSSASSNSKNTLTIGLQNGYPPFEFVDSNGEVIGFDIDLAQLIAAKLQKKLVVKDMGFEGLLISLKQGKIDLILSGMNITPSRLKEIALVPYHGSEVKSLSLLFWGKIPESVQSIDDIAKLPNPTISVETGTIFEDYLKRYPSIQVTTFEGSLNPLMDVKYGKSSATLVEPDVATYLMGKYPEIQLLSIPLPEDDHVLGFGIGISKAHAELIQKIQTIIAELKQSGELEKLEQKWFKGGAL